MPTGWRSANIAPGATVIVMGIGGLGANALQGAVHAGASTVTTVDPSPFQEEAQEFGATHSFADMDQATEYARSITNGQGADAVIITVAW